MIIEIRISFGSRNAKDSPMTYIDRAKVYNHAHITSKSHHHRPIFPEGIFR
jgi:hypothetical protein